MSDPPSRWLSDASPFAGAVSAHPLLFAVATWLALTWRFAGWWTGRLRQGHPTVALARPRDEPAADLVDHEVKARSYAVDRGGAAREVSRASEARGA